MRVDSNCIADRTAISRWIILTHTEKLHNHIHIPFYSRSDDSLSIIGFLSIYGHAGLWLFMFIFLSVMNWANECYVTRTQKIDGVPQNYNVTKRLEIKLSLSALNAFAFSCIQFPIRLRAIQFSVVIHVSTTTQLWTVCWQIEMTSCQYMCCDCQLFFFAGDDFW